MAGAGTAEHANPGPSPSTAADATATIFLCGDVMLGRGIDQILPHPCDPQLHESYVTSASDYVRLAEHASGPIPSPVDLSYVWGAALDELDLRRPDARIINLETSVTRSNDFVAKGINYHMSPENAGCLASAGIDCCVLANNHVLDWGIPGLLDTLATLDRLGIQYVGAGRNSIAAHKPAIVDRRGKGRVGEGRVVVYAFASVSSGAPLEWAATPNAAGISLLPDLSQTTATAIGDEIARSSRPGDIIIASIHWGPNWGYEISDQERRFAHSLIDRADVSIVHGHSSHHAKAIETYRDRLILYGCGDFLNDYEGIKGYENYRDDLAVMYFADLERVSGRLVGLEMVPLQIRRFRLNRASIDDVAWLGRTLDRESRQFGVRVIVSPRGTLKLSHT